MMSPQRSRALPDLSVLMPKLSRANARLTIQSQSRDEGCRRKRDGLANRPWRDADAQGK